MCNSKRMTRSCVSQPQVARIGPSRSPSSEHFCQPMVSYDNSVCPFRDPFLHEVGLHSGIHHKHRKRKKKALNTDPEDRRIEGVVFAESSNFRTCKSILWSSVSHDGKDVIVLMLSPDAHAADIKKDIGSQGGCNR